MNELVISNKVAASITFDKETAIKDVKANLASYYDEEGNFIPIKISNLPDSKKELAQLRKVSKAMNDKKIEVKKELLVEVVQFENDIKEVIKFVKEVEQEFDSQIKASEQLINDERQAEIISWEEFIAISEFIPFQNDWLKKSWKDDKKLKAELVSIKEVIDKDITSIKVLATSHELDSDKYIDMLKQGIDLTNILQRIVEDHTLLTKKPQEEIVIDTTEKATVITRNLKGTITQLKLLKQYAIKLGVEWSVVE